MTTQFLVAAVLLLGAVVVAVAQPAAPVINITEILDDHPEFAAFNAFLTRTNISNQINRRQTITVLAVNDAALVPAFAGKPLSVIKDVLSAHVILDYFGPPKLRRLVQEKKSSLVTTLFQASGRAVGQQGFLNVSGNGEVDGVAFGSAVKGAPLVSTLVGSVSARPYIISVLQVSAPIFPIGVDPNPSPPPPPVAKASPPPPEEDDEPAEPPVSEADAPVADAPEAVDDSEPPAAEAPEKSPAADEVHDGGQVEKPKNGEVAMVEVRFRALIIGLVLIFVAM